MDSLAGISINKRNPKFPSGFYYNDIRKILLDGDPVEGEYSDKVTTRTGRIIGLHKTRHGAVLVRPEGSIRWYACQDARRMRVGAP